MMRISNVTDERREAGAVECWCLHGAVGLASDWRRHCHQLATRGIGSRAVDLWRFLDCCSMPMQRFGAALSAEAAGEARQGSMRILVGYSMGGRLALHALLADESPWDAAVLVSAHPGLELASERVARRAADADWASRALSGDWAAFLDSWNSQAVLAGPGFPDERTRAARLRQRRREIARSFVDWSLGAQDSLWERLSEISVPVMWVSGVEDSKFSALAARAAGGMPRAAHHLLEDAGHRAPWQNESRFCDAVRDFLRDACHAI